MYSEIEDETDVHFKMAEEVVYPEIEPSVITIAMIDDAYLNVYDGEYGRLHQMMPIVYDRIEEIRLEHRNILRIDYLWCLPNLTKLSLNHNKLEVIENLEVLVNLRNLDLSFNYIEKIENLDKLEKLDVLSLFNNRINKIENLDSLQNLSILSIGNNLIDSVDGIERFRFMKKLRILNLEGNPIAQKKDFNLTRYVIAVVPDLIYYAYVQILDEEREKAQQMYKMELWDMESNQEAELFERERKEQERLGIERLASSFVELLDDHQLFNSLWDEDVDGKALLSIGEPAKPLFEDYDQNFFEITQQLYKFGLECYGERESEIQEFMENLKEGQSIVQDAGQKIIEEFSDFKEAIFEDATDVLKSLELRTLHGEDERSPVSLYFAEQYDDILIKFDEKVNDAWNKLMLQELHLHEAIEEACTNFQRIIQDQMSKFIEYSQGLFASLRELAVSFSENLSEIVSRFIAEKMALENFETVPDELKACATDKEALPNLIASMKDIHTLRIDEREDRLMTRSREFIENLIETVLSDEINRHRTQILEINSYLELMAKNLEHLQLDIREELANEET